MGTNGGSGSVIADPPNTTRAPSTKVKKPKAKKTKGDKKKAETKQEKKSLAGLTYQLLFHTDAKVSAADRSQFKKDFPGVSLLPDDLRTSVHTIFKHVGKKALMEAANEVDNKAS